MCSQNGTRFVLVVDDDLGIRETIADVLRDEGYTVITAANGQIALDTLRKSDDRPCVILLDLMMPVMSGQQFYAEKQNDPALSDIPVIVISADANVQQKAAAFGGECVPKPLRVEKVLDVVERHCA